MKRKLVPHHSHWGAFNAVVEDAKVVGAVPFDFAPDPSALIEAIPDAVYSPLRIARPMVRAGWLRDGRVSGKGRGHEPFVPVSWERSVDLVAGELQRVRREHGPSAIMGGSQGWSSAGHLHEARGQLLRFLAASGGFVDQISNYSFGTALTFLPHILGSPQSGHGALDVMDFDRAAYAAFRHVRRRQPEEHPGRQRRLRLARHQRRLRGAR